MIDKASARLTHRLQGALGSVAEAAETIPVAAVVVVGSVAETAAATLRKLGYANVHALAGGMAAWREAGLPTEKSGTAAG